MQQSIVNNVKACQQTTINVSGIKETTQSRDEIVKMLFNAGLMMMIKNRHIEL